MNNTSNKERFIDATAMREDWLENGENEYVYDTNSVLDSIDAQPTADVVKAVHGHWEDISETTIPLPGMMTPITNTAETCSVCKVRVGFVGPKRYLYDKQCPNCGAFMDE